MHLHDGHEFFGVRGVSDVASKFELERKPAVEANHQSLDGVDDQSADRP
jgi:hypothetical protein